MLEYTSEEAFRHEVAAFVRPILVQFSAGWCAPCRAIAPMIQEVVELYADVLSVFKINVDEAVALAAEYNVKSVPALILLQDRTTLHRFEEQRTLSRLSAFLDKYVG